MPHFISSLSQPTERTEVGWWFAFRGPRLLVAQTAAGQLTIPAVLDLAEMGLAPLRSHCFGLLDGRACYAAELPEEAALPENYQFMGLRQLFGQLDEPLMRVAMRALPIVDWDRNHQFCGRCATPLEPAQDRAKVCPQCNLRAYPRISPAIIVLVQRGDTILLARATRHPQGFYSVLAGFAEPGETLEEAVVREIEEEAGLQVQNIRYFGSQPWPFPDSLMIDYALLKDAILRAAAMEELDIERMDAALEGARAMRQAAEQAFKALSLLHRIESSGGSAGIDEARKDLLSE